MYRIQKILIYLAKKKNDKKVPRILKGLLFSFEKTFLFFKDL